MLSGGYVRICCFVPLEYQDILQWCRSPFLICVKWFCGVALGYGLLALTLLSIINDNLSYQSAMVA